VSDASLPSAMLSLCLQGFVDDERQGARNFPMKIPFSAAADPSSSFLTSQPPPDAAGTMPLIIISGLPSSGKTTRAHQLQKALEDKIASSQRKFRVHVINDDTLGINRQVYKGTYPRKYLLMERCEGGKSCTGNVLQCYTACPVKRRYRHCRRNELYQGISVPTLL
jgi:Chromatin associated protein KTI12